MAQVTIREQSANRIEIEMDSEWVSLGKMFILQYAENLASAFTLGGRWKASQYSPTRGDTSRITIMLTKAV